MLLSLQSFKHCTKAFFDEQHWSHTLLAWKWFAYIERSVNLNANSRQTILVIHALPLLALSNNVVFLYFPYWLEKKFLFRHQCHYSYYRFESSFVNWFWWLFGFTFFPLRFGRPSKVRNTVWKVVHGFVAALSPSRCSFWFPVKGFRLRGSTV